jgi:hypothetical protein
MGKKKYTNHTNWLKNIEEEIDTKMKERNRIASLSTFEKFAIWLDNFWKNIAEKIR